MNPSDSSDQIFIRGLKVACHIGVPNEERAQSQELLINVTMAPIISADAAPLNDDINRTIDYHAVAVRVEAVAAERPRQLIETLAEDITTAILEEFSIASITVEIEKFILPNTRCVGVLITRNAATE